MKSSQVKNTDAGMTRLTEIRVDSAVSDDPFLDSYSQQMFVCHAIIDRVKMSSTKSVIVIIDRKFLETIIHSHLNHIRGMETS
jgi:hypothetical protein